LWVVPIFKFYQNRLSGFGAVRFEICHFSLLWSLPITVQAVMPFLANRILSHRKNQAKPNISRKILYWFTAK